MLLSLFMVPFYIMYWILAIPIKIVMWCVKVSLKMTLITCGAAILLLIIIL